jgi:hypothetical protein
LNLIVTGQVCRDSDRLAAGCRYFLLDLFELSRCAGSQNDPAAALCEIESNSPADAAAGAGDNGYFSCQAVHWNDGESGE